MIPGNLRDNRTVEPFQPRDPYLGGKPTPREWLRGSAKAGSESRVKAKRRAAGKRARAARKANR